jgi:predicted PurR-regulated permease PerM
MVRRDSVVNGFSMALGAVALLILLYVAWRLLQAVANIIMPFAVAVIFALLLNPLVMRVERAWFRGKRGPAVGIVFLGFLLVFVGLVGFLVPNLIEQTTRLVRFFSPVTYRVERAPARGGLWIEVADDLTVTSHTVTKLDNDDSYQFRVTARDADGRTYPLRTVTATPNAQAVPPGSSKKSDGAPLAGNGDTTPPPSPEPTVATPTPTPSAEPTPTPASPPVSSSPAPSVRPGETLRQSPDGLPAHAGQQSVAGVVSPLPAALEPGDVAAYAGDGQVRLVWKPPTEVKSRFEQLRAEADAWLLSHRKIGPVALPPDIATLQSQYSTQLSQALQEGSRRLAGAIIGSVSTLLIVVVIPILTFYILNDMERLRARFLMLLPEPMRDHFLNSAEVVGGVFGSYLRGMFSLAVLYGAVTMVLFFLFDLRGYALLLGFIAGVLYPVPYIGPLFTTFLAAVVSLMTGHALPHALLMVGVVQGTNLVFDNVMVPRIVGKGVGLHPLTTVFALFLGSELFGLWGMLFSVPLAASIQQVLYRLFPNLAAPTPIALMMGNRRGNRSSSDGTGQTAIPSTTKQEGSSQTND